MFGIVKGILVQQVNCKNDMDAGLAKAIYEQCPQVKEDYHNSFKEKSAEELFGTYRLIDTGSELKIANLYTQFDCTDSSRPESYGKKYTDVDKLINVIKKLNEDYPDETIYIPYKIGCGLAGGDWTEVIERLNSLQNSKFVILNTLAQTTSSTAIENFNAIIEHYKNKFNNYSGKYFKITVDDYYEIKNDNIQLKIIADNKKFEFTIIIRVDNSQRVYTVINVGISDIKQIFNHAVYMYTCVESDKLAIEDLTELLS